MVGGINSTNELSRVGRVGGARKVQPKPRLSRPRPSSWPPQAPLASLPNREVGSLSAVFFLLATASKTTTLRVEVTASLAKPPSRDVGCERTLRISSTRSRLRPQCAHPPGGYGRATPRRASVRATSTSTRAAVCSKVRRAAWSLWCWSGCDGQSVEIGIVYRGVGAGRVVGAAAVGRSRAASEGGGDGGLRGRRGGGWWWRRGRWWRGRWR